jgi:ribose/xylose/arabinose/galactoside ABC-type transport system permease subunit
MFPLNTRGFDLSIGTAVSMISVLDGMVIAAYAKAHPDMAVVVGGISLRRGEGAPSRCRCWARCSSSFFRMA